MKAQLDLPVDFQRWGYMLADQYIDFPLFLPVNQDSQELSEIRGVQVLCDFGTKTLVTVGAPWVNFRNLHFQGLIMQVSLF